MPFGEEPIDSLQLLYHQFLAVDDNLLKDKIKLFPNPTNSVLNIAYDHTILLARVSITDVQGKLIKTQDGNGTSTRTLSVNTATLETSMCFLRVETLQGVTTLGFVKE
jgi:hypothetical protein